MRIVACIFSILSGIIGLFGADLQGAIIEGLNIFGKQNAQLLNSAQILFYLSWLLILFGGLSIKYPKTSGVIIIFISVTAFSLGNIFSAPFAFLAGIFDLFADSPNQKFNTKGSILDYAIFAILCFILPFGILSSLKNTSKPLEYSDKHIEEEWIILQSCYQRRSDLVPNLVSTIKGSDANFDESTLIQVIQARAEAVSNKIDFKELTPERLKMFGKLQEALNQEINKLMTVSEQNQKIKENENFKSLQDQLEGVEQRIKIEHDAFNEAVKKYGDGLTPLE